MGTLRPTRNRVTLIPRTNTPIQQNRAVGVPPAWPAYVLILAAFGPYVIPAARLMVAQLVLYPLAIWGLFVLAEPRRWARVRPLAPIPALLLFLVLWPILATAATASTRWMLLLAQLDNLVQPLATSLVALAVVSITPRAGLTRLLANCTALLVALLGANTLVALWTAITGDYPDALLRFWSPPAGSGLEKMMDMSIRGRITGIFAQPAENGLTYSFGLLFCLWWLQTEPRSARPFAAALTILIGGGLAQSKSFYVSIPLGAAYLLACGRLRQGVALIAAIGVAGLTMAGPLGLGDWALHSGVAAKVSPERGLSGLTAGRYGEGSGTVATLWPRVVDSPWFGYGLAANRFGPLDSEPLARLLAGGLPALGAYAVLLCFVVAVGLRAVPRRPVDGWLGLMLALYYALGGLGMSVFGANRVAIVGVLLLVVTLAQCTPYPAEASILHPETVPPAARERPTLPP